MYVKKIFDVFKFNMYFLLLFFKPILVQIPIDVSSKIHVYLTMKILYLNTLGRDHNI